MAKSKCFIIMPISTAGDLVEIYSGDKHHFEHVLEHLFIPAIQKSGMEPVPPLVKGAKVIHGEIIKNIESLEFVLCDMSTLNPNVFFELGVRTAVNKPVAMVIDNKTSKVPFDTNIINYHTYHHSLAQWMLDSEIDKLSEHLNHCFESPNTENSLWKYFSLSSKVPSVEKPTTSDDKIEFLSMQVAALRKQLENIVKLPSEEKEVRYLDLIQDVVKDRGIEIHDAIWDDGRLAIISEEPFPAHLRETFTKMASADGLDLIFHQEQKK